MSETIGQRLKKVREYRNLTIEKAADATHIRGVYLQALEADDLSAIPSPVQARGFLRNYAEYLDLDLEQMIEDIRVAHPESNSEQEIVFDGEPQPVAPSPENIETESMINSDSAEPFWQTWLRRVKQEAGEVAEGSVSDQNAESAVVLGEASSLEAEASRNADTHADEVEYESESRLKLWESLVSRANFRISRNQEETSDVVEVEAEPIPEEENRLQSSDMTTSTSHEIINDIGLQLRQRREMLSLTLEEIERHTRMRAQFLKSLESGKFDELPSPVQTRGMLSNYGSFLDLDVDALLLQFAEALQARHRERHPDGPVRKRKQVDIPSSVPTLRSFIAGDMVFGVGVAIMLVVFSIWGISQVISLQSGQDSNVQVEATGPSISEAIIGTPIESSESEVILIPAEDTPIPELTEGTFIVPTPDFTVNVQVNIVALERTFLRVWVDEEEVFNGRTVPGNAYLFEAEQSIEVLVGNGAAVRVIYNQRDMGLLGGFGQVAGYIYTIDEILVPTPVVPPTLTNTPYISPTPSITPSPTATSRPSAEGVE